MATPGPKPAPSTPGLEARRIATVLLHNVLTLGKALEPMLQRQFGNLSPSDRGLARALVSGVLRNLNGLDALIDSAMRLPLAPDARARQVLRVALAGRLLLGTPPHAAIATALPLVESGPRRLVHGVRSNLFRRNPELPAPRLPAPWDAMWEGYWGAEEVRFADRRLNAVPPTDLTLRDPSQTAFWAEKLGGISLAHGHVRLLGSQQIERLEGFAEGHWWVQDLAASLPARLMGALEGRDVLDLCAAPGGKTMQLAAAGAKVTALDNANFRLRRLAENLERTQLEAEVIQADAMDWRPGRLFDAILLDAPCSASGTFRRHPDLLYLKQSMDIQKLVRLQRAMRDRAAQWLKPGGVLVYAVCSLEPDEGENQPVPEGMVADPVMPSEVPAGVAITDGAIRTLPSTLDEAGGVDGFYIARYRRA